MCKGCQGDVQGGPGRCARVAGEMYKSCRGDVQRLPGRCARVAGEMCKGAKVKSTPSPRPKTKIDLVLIELKPPKHCWLNIMLYKRLSDYALLGN